MDKWLIYLKTQNMKTDRLYIMYYTESNGNRYAEAVTDNLDEWIKYHNSGREEEDKEELDDFEIEIINYFKHN